MEILGSRVEKPDGKGHIDLVYCEPGFFASMFNSKPYYRVDVYNNGKRISKVNLPRDTIEARFDRLDEHQFFIEGTWMTARGDEIALHRTSFAFDYSGKLVKMG